MGIYVVDNRSSVTVTILTTNGSVRSTTFSLEQLASAIHGLGCPHPELLAHIASFCRSVD